jgi:hypothetical protein
MTRRTIILCILVALMGQHAVAQQKQPQDSRSLKLDYVGKIEKYRKMRGAGAALTVIGSILSVAGTVTAMNNMDFFIDDGDDSAYAAGTICALAGYGMLGAGIPLWIVGGVQHKKYSTKLQELSIKINATPQSQGLALNFRF